MNTDPKNPLFQLTVGDLIEVLKETFPALGTGHTEEEKPSEGPTFKGQSVLTSRTRRTRMHASLRSRLS